MLVAVACGAIGDGTGEFARGWIDALPAAFERLGHDGVKRDPACPGKTAIARCLRDLDAGAEEVLLVGVRTVQREPVWGTSVDTAAELRGVCVMGLVERQHPRAWVEEMLDGAKREIVALGYEISHANVLGLLRQAASRGCHVVLVGDRERVDRACQIFCV
jgi:hypothetical protein